MQIREFREDDYAALAAVVNQCLEGVLSPESVTELREVDARREAKYAFYRFVAVEDGAIVGFAEVFEPWYFYAPGRWQVDVEVAAPYRGRGVGRALAERLRAVLSDKDVNLLFAGCVEDKPGHRFAAKHDFQVMVREPLTHLDLAAFDASVLPEKLARAQAAGVRLDSARVVLAEVPDAIERWWELGWLIQQDIPFNRPIQRRPLEEFAKRFKEQSFVPDLWVVARDAGGDFVGLSGLKPTADPATLLTTITGVTRAYRRKGIATAMKYSALAAAQARGARWVHTDNEENNPMLGLNKRLGFREVGAWLCLEREVQSAG